MPGGAGVVRAGTGCVVGLWRLAVAGDGSGGDGARWRGVAARGRGRHGRVELATPRGGDDAASDRARDRRRRWRAIRAG